MGDRADTYEEDQSQICSPRLSMHIARCFLRDILIHLYEFEHLELVQWGAAEDIERFKHAGFEPLGRFIYSFTALERAINTDIAHVSGSKPLPEATFYLH